MKKAIIIDLDNTLCDASHRMDVFYAEEFEKFHELLSHDTVNRNVARLIRCYKEFGIKPIFVTARKEMYREKTLNWFKKNLPDLSADILLFMKPDYSNDDDGLVKQSIYRQYIVNTWKVILVLDDRDVAVKKWRDLGLECWQVAKGDY